jgi:hypothetical protein
MTTPSPATPPTPTGKYLNIEWLKNKLDLQKIFLITYIPIKYY